jgi:hypothetical protein
MRMSEMIFLQIRNENSPLTAIGDQAPFT